MATRRVTKREPVLMIPATLKRSFGPYEKGSEHFALIRNGHVDLVSYYGQVPIASAVSPSDFELHTGLKEIR